MSMIKHDDEVDGGAVVRKDELDKLFARLGVELESAINKSASPDPKDRVEKAINVLRRSGVSGDAIGDLIDAIGPRVRRERFFKAIEGVEEEGGSRSAIEALVDSVAAVRKVVAGQIPGLFTSGSRAGWDSDTGDGIPGSSSPAGRGPFEGARGARVTISVKPGGLVSDLLRMQGPGHELQILKTIAHALSVGKARRTGMGELAASGDIEVTVEVDAPAEPVRKKARVKKGATDVSTGDALIAAAEVARRNPGHGRGSIGGFRLT